MAGQDIIIGALLSGLLGTIATLYWMNRQATRKDKLEILTVLLSYRGREDSYALSQIAPAINRIEVVFSGNDKILGEVKNFINKRNVFDIEKKSDAEKSNITKEMNESYTNLVLAIAKNLNYKNITFDVVSTPYIPKGVSDHYALQDAKIKKEIAMCQAVINSLPQTSTQLSDEARQTNGQ
ncbi:DUF6680 family protein [Aeromonas veronii]